MIRVPFVDLSEAARRDMVRDMGEAFGKPGVLTNPRDWPTRWWSAEVCANRGAVAIIQPPRGARPTYMDKLWSLVRGHGFATQLLASITDIHPRLHWRTTHPGWYTHWAQNRAGQMASLSHSDYWVMSFVAAGAVPRMWEAEDALDWLRMRSAWDVE
jgi:hypothetical protein